MDTIKNNNSDDDKSNSMEKINIKTENNLINVDNNNNLYLKTINSEYIYYNQGNYKPNKRGFSSIKKQKKIIKFEK